MPLIVPQDLPAGAGMIIAIEILGLLSAWATRCSEGSAWQAWFHRLFYACLLLVGFATVVAFGVGPGCWISCGATLSVMVVGATCDFSREAV